MKVSKLVSRKKVSFIRVGTLLVGFVGVFLWIVNVQGDSLKWEQLAEMSDSEREKIMDEICEDSEKLYFPTMTNSPFPSESPNNIHYIDLKKTFIGEKDTLGVYREDTGKKIGSYTSKLSELIIYCWAKDNSGVYISDYERGSGSIAVIGGKSSETGPVKKLLVPQ